eukprot:1187244-Prorocentrum_minimum.AAC.5
MAQVRRLYDIANILASLNLIEKTHLTDSRKPAFKWLYGEPGMAPGAGAAHPALSPQHPIPGSGIVPISTSAVPQRPPRASCPPKPAAVHSNPCSPNAAAAAVVAAAYKRHLAASSGQHSGASRSPSPPNYLAALPGHYPGISSAPPEALAVSAAAAGMQPWQHAHAAQLGQLNGSGLKRSWSTGSDDVAAFREEAVKRHRQVLPPEYATAAGFYAPAPASAAAGLSRGASPDRGAGAHGRAGSTPPAMAASTLIQKGGPIGMSAAPQTGSGSRSPTKAKGQAGKEGGQGRGNSSEPHSPEDATPLGGGGGNGAVKVKVEMKASPTSTIPLPSGAMLVPMPVPGGLIHPMHLAGLAAGAGMGIPGIPGAGPGGMPVSPAQLAAMQHIPYGAAPGAVNSPHLVNGAHGPPGAMRGGVTPADPDGSKAAMAMSALQYQNHSLTEYFTRYTTAWKMWYWHLASQQSRLSAGVPDPAAAAKTAAVYAPPGSVDVSMH